MCILQPKEFYNRISIYQVFFWNKIHLYSSYIRSSTLFLRRMFLDTEYVSILLWKMAAHKNIPRLFFCIKMKVYSRPLKFGNLGRCKESTVAVFYASINVQRYIELGIHFSFQLLQLFTIRWDEEIASLA